MSRSTKQFTLDRLVHGRRKLAGTLACRRCGEEQQIGSHVVTRQTNSKTVLYCDLCADLLNII